MLDLVGPGGRGDHFPREVSGGQQQRVGIARSPAIEPAIWFLDEPFSALDPLIRREMPDEFLRLKPQAERTIVFITHDFDEALRLADRIAIIRHGAVAQCDTPDRINAAFAFARTDLGLMAVTRAPAADAVRLVCDTLQTFPSFIYLIPVVMLFGVSDVAVLTAVMVFATVPIVRYTIEGLASVPPETVEAAQMSGATVRQMLWHVRLPLALPTILVGVNQSIMFALFMGVIAAFIGTQDLGQEMQRALSMTDVGKGLVLGLAVAFLGLMADHLLLTWSRRLRARHGP